jgi:phosphoglycerate dehydrogenase-like enzyme
MQMKKYRIAVLDDYQNFAFENADWSVLGDRADITVFQDHLADPDSVIQRLVPFDVVCVMRERTPLPRNVIERLPNLKLIASTGPGNESIDETAAGDREIRVLHTGYRSEPAIEFTWALILASTRYIVAEINSVRSGGWQQAVGADLRGKTLGVLGLGRIGSHVAQIGSAFVDRGVGENETLGSADQYIARRDRRRASFDYQATRHAGLHKDHHARRRQDPLAAICESSHLERL